MTTAPGAQPVEEQKAAEDERPLTGWPHQPIQDLKDEEREALLVSGGPTGEMARVAWAQYQAGVHRQDEPGAGNAATGEGIAGMGTGVGMQESPVIPVAGASTAGPAPAPVATEEIDTPEEEAAETGAQTERAAAEAKAAERGLEIRDYGTEGEWRVYDPATGRQVAKSRLDAPVA